MKAHTITRIIINYYIKKYMYIKRNTSEKLNSFKDFCVRGGLKMKVVGDIGNYSPVIQWSIFRLLFILSIIPSLKSNSTNFSNIIYKANMDEYPL